MHAPRFGLVLTLLLAAIAVLAIVAALPAGGGAYAEDGAPPVYVVAGSSMMRGATGGRAGEGNAAGAADADRREVRAGDVAGPEARLVSEGPVLSGPWALALWGTVWGALVLALWAGTISWRTRARP